MTNWFSAIHLNRQYVFNRAKLLLANPWIRRVQRVVVAWDQLQNGVVATFDINLARVGRREGLGNRLARAQIEMDRARLSDGE